jgi:hypothetical protein
MKLSRKDIQNTLEDAARFGTSAGPFSNPQYTPSWVRGLCKNFLETFNDLEGHADTLDKCVAERDEKIKALEAQLEALKPPEPKFRVGQFVALWDGTSGFRITERKFSSDSEKLANQNRGHWIYRGLYTGLGYDENALRALTTEEIQ